MQFPHHLKTIGGYALIAAGILIAIAGPFHPDEFVAGNILASAWKPVHLALLLAFTLSVFGVAGIFSIQRTSAFNSFSYFIAMIGAALSAALVVVELFVLPAIAATATVQKPLMEMMSPETPFKYLGYLFFTAYTFWLAGWILTGINLLRKFPKYIGWCIIVSSIAIAIPTHFAGGAGTLLRTIVAMFFGITWMLAGTNLLKFKIQN